MRRFCRVGEVSNVWKTRGYAASLKNAVKNRFFYALVGSLIKSGVTIRVENSGEEIRVLGSSARRFGLKAFCANIAFRRRASP